MRHLPEGASLSAFLRAWAWPFDEGDEDVAAQGSGFALWSREKGHDEAEILVFRFDEAGIDLAANPAFPDRRLALSSAQIDALAEPLIAYLEGESDHSDFVKSHPAAAAILAIYHEAWAEASAIDVDEIEADEG